MCNMTSRKEVMIKIMAVLSLFCLAECASGSCMTYGHACWGAHGKRSDSPNLPPEKNEPSKTLKSRWFLSRLIQSPSDLRLLRDEDFDVLRKSNSEPLFSLDDIDAVRGQEQWRNNHEMAADEQLFDDNFVRTEENNKMGLPRFLEKRSVKQN